MYTIINTNHDPHYNLALEEYVLKYLDSKEDFILLWQNEPSVIIGRNQNTIEEINQTFIKENQIHVVRRNSGGGAVYHDLGNLNFSFITTSGKDNVHNFKKFTEPVIEALKTFGVEAEFAGRNDILVEGKKISGNAQSYYRNKMLHHGTILFNCDLNQVANVLNVKLEKIESKGIKSVRSRVSNIYPYLTEKVSIQEFEDKLLKFLLGTEDIKSKLYTLTDHDEAKIQELVQTKYNTWEWNYGESPAFTLQKQGRFTGGKLDIRLNVQEGLIEQCKIFGDFFGLKDISELETLLIHERFEEMTIRHLLENQDLEQFSHNITVEDFIQCLFY